MFNQKSSLLDKGNNEVAELDHIGGKLISLVVLGLLASFATGFALFNLVQGTNANLMYWLLLLFLGFFMSALVLQSLVIKNRSLALLITSGELLFLSLPFYKQIIHTASYSVFGMLLLTLVYFFWGYLRGVSEHQNSLKIKFFGVAKPVLAKSATAISFFIVLVYFFLFGFKNLTITPAWVDMILSPTTSLVNYYLPGFNPRGSVNDVLGSFAKKQLEGIGSDGGNKSEQASQINQAVRDVKKQISGFVDFTVTGNETVNELLSSIFNKFANRARESSNKLVLGGAAILLFLIIRTTAPIINFFISILAYLIYQFLLTIDFIHIPSESKPKEIVNFKHY